MTSFLAAIAGILVAAVVSPEDTAMREDSRLYMRIRTDIERRIELPVEDEVKEFAVRVLKADKKDISVEDVEAAMEGNLQGRCGDRGLDFGTCRLLEQSIRSIVDRERRIRSFGRDLFQAAGGYEMTVSEHLGKIFTFTPDMAALLRFWQSATDALFTPDLRADIRAAPFPEDEEELKRLYKEVEEALLPEEEIPGMIARYRFGYRPVRREGPCPEGVAPKASELTRLEDRWCPLEQKLEALLRFLSPDIESTDQESAGSAIVLFPTWLYPEKNIMVWATNRDIGLDWEVPLEPVLPELVDNRDYGNCMEEVKNEAFCNALREQGIFLGGLSVPPPETPDIDTGVCHLPLARSGYLCRPMESTTCADGSSSSTGTPRERNVITLTPCRTPPLAAGIPEKITLSGPNICGIGGWQKPATTETRRDTQSRDSSIRPNACSRCAVDMYCSSSCPGDEVATFAKDENGIIPVCLPSKGGPGLRYGVIHELVHAQQFCDEPASVLKTDLASCCAMEYQAYFVQCGALATDGILDDVAIDEKTTSISPEECAATLSTLSCKEFGKCHATGFDPQKMSDVILKAIKDNADRLGLPTSCAEAIQSLDPRAQAMIDSLPSVCTPECTTQFDNTIGNTLCYIGQCIEQSWEEERLVPGQVPLTTAGEAFPWDSCIAPEPLSDPTPPWVAEITMPTLAEPVLPSYKPAEVAQQLDGAFCQIYGLPVQTPPTLCQGDLSRRLGLPLSDYSEMASSFIHSITHMTDPALRLQRLAPGIGARLGATLFSEQIGPRARGIADFFNTAAELLEEISTTRFPEIMCSRNDGTCPIPPPLGPAEPPPAPPL